MAQSHGRSAASSQPADSRLPRTTNWAKSVPARRGLAGRHSTRFMLPWPEADSLVSCSSRSHGARARFRILPSPIRSRQQPSFCSLARCFASPRWSGSAAATCRQFTNSLIHQSTNPLIRADRSRPSALGNPRRKGIARVARHSKTTLANLRPNSLSPCSPSLHAVISLPWRCTRGHGLLASPSI
jgi:hypothetical protein